MVLRLALLGLLFVVVVAGLQHRHGAARRDASCGPTAPCTVDVAADRSILLVDGSTSDKNASATATFDKLIRGATLSVTLPTRATLVSFVASSGLVCEQGVSTVTCRTQSNTTSSATIAVRYTVSAATSIPAGVNATDIAIAAAVSGPQQCSGSRTQTLRLIFFCKRGAVGGRCGTTVYNSWASSPCGARPGTSCVLRDEVRISKAETIFVADLIIATGGSLIIEEVDGNQFAVVVKAQSILIENGGALRVGNESTPFGRFGSTVDIKLYGNVSTTPIACTTPQCGVSDNVWGVNGTWTKNAATDQFDLPSGGGPDYFYAYRDATFTVGGATLNDGMFGRKVLALSYGGTLELHGAWGNGPTSADGASSWRPVAQPVAQAQTTVALAGADWNAVASTWPQNRTFQVVLTSTDWFVSHNEVLSATLQGSNIVFAEGAKFPHLGNVVSLADGQHSQITRRRRADLRARLGLLTRSITISSMGNVVDTPLQNGYGGHIIVRQGFAACKVEGVALYQLGQAPYKGRYPMHFHLARKTSGAYFRRSTIYDSNTRFVAIHGTHGVDVSGNVALKSVGHGFYIEDGSETDNTIEWNLSVWVRAGFTQTVSDYSHNERNAIPIFCHPGPDVSVVGKATYQTDCRTPSHFWIRNPRNRIRNNFAVGAEAIGTGYWFIGGAMSMPSSQMRWDNTNVQAMLLQRVSDQQQLYGPGAYQNGYPTITDFDGNSASGMNFFVNTVKDFGSSNWLPAVAPPNDPPPVKTLQINFNQLISYSADEIPFSESGVIGADPIYCPPGARLTSDCPGPCGVSDGDASRKSCGTHIISNFTGSFGAADVSFSSMWLRPHFFFVVDTWLTDVLFGGLNFVNSGDPGGVVIGYWGTCAGCVFYGDTQRSASRYALPRGPVLSNSTSANDPLNPTCDNRVGYAGGSCVLPFDGRCFPYADYSMASQYFKIYDGPASLVQSAFVNIVPETLSGADVCPNAPVPVGQVLNKPWCAVKGIPLSEDGKTCILPHTSIGWKQPNGFDYPPAYLLRNLTFQDVDIRHFVNLPQFLPNSFENDVNGTAALFCNNSVTFPNWAGAFTHIDRQTSLSDYGGSLTGLTTDAHGPDTPSFVINNDAFFHHPGYRVECASLRTSLVSPNHFSRLYVRVSGWQGAGSCKNAILSALDANGVQSPSIVAQCRLMQAWRLSFDNSTETATQVPPAIWLQGPTGVMGSLEMEGTTYLIDITPLTEFGDNYQTDYNYWSMIGPDGGAFRAMPNQPARFYPYDVRPSSGQDYFFQLLYPAATMEPLTYVLWVGSGLQLDTGLEIVQYRKTPDTFLNIPVPDGRFPAGARRVSWGNRSSIIGNSTFPQPWADANFLNFLTASLSNGYLTVTLNFRAIQTNAIWTDGAKERCGPVGFCSWTDATNSCHCNRPTSDPFAYPSIADACETVCSLAGGVFNPECPSGGCLGFIVHLPKGSYTPQFDYAKLTAWPTNVTEIARKQFGSTIAGRSLKARPSDGQCP